VNADLKEVARRAVACPRWRWMDGMRVICTPRHDGATGYFIRLEQDGYRAAQNEYPDLSDPATVGCLLALVREAWGSGFHLVPDGGWLARGARMPDGATVNLGVCERTEVAALVAALESSHNRA
jgi:hypothetical protein